MPPEVAVHTPNKEYLNNVQATWEPFRRA